MAWAPDGRLLVSGGEDEFVSFYCRREENAFHIRTFVPCMHTCARIHAYIHVYVYICVCVCVQNIHIHTCISHRYVYEATKGKKRGSSEPGHTYIHTYIHTYAQIPYHAGTLME